MPKTRTYYPHFDSLTGKRLTVQQLIDALSKVKNKDLPIEITGAYGSVTELIFQVHEGDSIHYTSEQAVVIGTDLCSG